MKASISDLEAVGLALAGFTLWVLADTSIKIAGNSRLPAYEVVAFQGFFIVVFLILRDLGRSGIISLWPKRPWPQVVRGCLDLGNNLCVVVALRHLPLSLFYILVFMAPMTIAILAAIFLRERLSWRTSSAILVGFSGVVIAVDPFSSARRGDWIGYLACIICVACFSANMVWSRVIMQTERPESLTFFSGLVMAVAGVVLMVWHFEPLTVKLVTVLGAMGIFCTIGSICFFVALKYTSAANVSQYHYTQLITGTFIAYLIWHDKPSTSMLIGGALIIASGLYIAILASRGRSSASQPALVTSDE